MPERPVRAILFDYSHTLADYGDHKPHILSAYQEIERLLTAEAIAEVPGAEHLIEKVARRIDKEIGDSYLREEIEELDLVGIMDSAFRDLGIQLPQPLLWRCVELEHRAIGAVMTVPPATLDTLAELKRRGYQTGLVSNMTLLAPMMRADLDRLGLTPYLDATVFSCETGLRKPDPSIYRFVLDRLDVPPAQAAFVGDRMKEDVRAPRSLGMRGVLTHEFRQEEDPAGEADLIIKRLPELLPWLEG